MAHRIARCEQALLNAVDAMQGCMDSILNCGESDSGSHSSKQKGSNTNGCSSHLGCCPMTEEEEHVLYQHATSVLRQTNSGKINPNTHQLFPTDEDPPAPSFISKSIEKKNTKIPTSCGFRREREENTVCEVTVSDRATRTRIEITDVDRQKLVSAIEIRKREIQRIALAATHAFNVLRGTIEQLPDVPIERVDADLKELTNENLALRDEVVGLYDQATSIYKRCISGQMMQL